MSFDFVHEKGLNYRTKKLVKPRTSHDLAKYPHFCEKEAIDLHTPCATIMPNSGQAGRICLVENNVIEDTLLHRVFH